LAPTQKETHNQKAVINTPQINLQEFSKNIARMINNFDTLLNPKQILLNRVENYIMTNYDQRTAQELMDMLAQNYNLSTSEREQEDKENNPTSYSVGALSSEG
jgi:predicted transcriptional regulator